MRDPDKELLVYIHKRKTDLEEFRQVFGDTAVSTEDTAGTYLPVTSDQRYIGSMGGRRLVTRMLDVVRDKYKHPGFRRDIETGARATKDEVYADPSVQVGPMPSWLLSCPLPFFFFQGLIPDGSPQVESFDILYTCDDISAGIAENAVYAFFSVHLGAGGAVAQTAPKFASKQGDAARKFEETRRANPVVAAQHRESCLVDPTTAEPRNYAVGSGTLSAE